MIRKSRGIGALAAAALSSATVFGGLFATVGGGVASAALSTTGSIAGETIHATSTPNIYPGATGQKAGNWTFTLNNNFTQAERIVINVGPGSGAFPDQCNSGSSYVAFAGIPTVTPTALSVTSGAGDSVPSITATTGTQATDGLSCAGIKDQLVLTVNNDATGNNADTWTVTLSGIQYNVGAATPAPPATPIGVVGTDTSGPTGSVPQTTTVDPNAVLQPVAVTANVPPVGIQLGKSSAISNIVIKEFLPGQVTGNGSKAVTVTLPPDDLFMGSATVTATNATVSNASAGTYAGSATITMPSAGSNTFSFYVTPSSTLPATFTISGLTVAVDTGATPGPQAVAINYNGTNTVSTTAFAAIGATRVAGFTADDTAAASLADAFGSGGSNDLRRNCIAGLYDSEVPSIVLASDFTPYDALSANYLASYLGTGVLITTYNTASQAVLNTIRQDGVGCVYIVGGTLAVSQAVQTQLENTQAYFPGGVTPVPGALGPTHLNVVRIAGVTADETASDVAQYPGVNAAGDLPATPAAYGSYNDTTGRSSTAGPGATGYFTTAIMATDVTFQDALSSGPLSYADDLPVLVTPQGSLSNAAAAALVNLGIQQVLLVGGPGAVSDAVVSQIEALGISVLRVAGLTYSDTSVQLANFELNNQNSATPSVTNGLDICSTPGSVASSRGDFFADALTSAAAAYYNSSEFCDFSPMMLTQNTSTVGPEVTGFLNAAGSAAGIGSDNVNLYSLQVFGGTLAQTPALVQAELNAIAAG